MATALNFRSAFNGFNREDVLHYIEYLNANHDNQIKQLHADLAAVQKDAFLSEDNAQIVAQMQDQFQQQEAVLTALNAEKDELLSKCAQLEAALATLVAENKALADQAAQMESQLAAQPAMSSYVEEELAAYRRAERVERIANERANAIYNKLCVALQDTAAKADQAVANMGSISDQFSTQLNVLQEALCDSRAYLDQTINSLEDVCPIPTEA